MSDADAVQHSVGVVVVAAGSGSRLGAARPKAFVELAGATLLEHALSGVHAAGVSCVAVVVPGELLDEAREIAGRVAGRGRASSIVVAGGVERTDSVRRGLQALDPGCDIVLVHDAARCLTPVPVFARVVGAVAGGAAGAVPGIPVVDTVKTVDARGVVTGTPDRGGLRSVQTPQGFAADVLRAAYADGDPTGVEVTDDAGLVEAGGHEVVVVEGDPLAFKITTGEDLARAELLLSGEGR